MSNTVQILAGEEQYIQALYSSPQEKSFENLDRLLVIMVHGFPGYKEAHNDIFKDLEHVTGDKSYHTLRFDFRGCGESDGRQEDFSLLSAGEDLQTVLSWAKDRGYKRFIFIAEGLGAPITLMNTPDETVCMIMLWPMLDMPHIAKTLFQAEAIEEQWKKAGYILKDEDRIGLPFLQQLPKQNIASALKDLNGPILIMHGAQDEISPISQLDIVRTHAGARRIEITSFQDGAHGLPEPNHRKTIFYHMMQFIEKYT